VTWGEDPDAIADARWESCFHECGSAAEVKRRYCTPAPPRASLVPAPYDCTFRSLREWWQLYGFAMKGTT
jgi:hypothetical protein